MGGSGSGRRRRRPCASAAFPWPLATLADDLAAARAVGAPIHGVMRWPVAARGEIAVGYTLEARDGGAVVQLGQAGGNLPIDDTMTIVACDRPGRGQVRYWRCGCGRRASILYADTACFRWRCRHCVGVVYPSSRRSDARISLLLRLPVPLGALPGEQCPADPEAITALDRYTRAMDQRYSILVETAARLKRTHGSQGRPKRRKTPAV